MRGQQCQENFDPKSEISQLQLSFEAFIADKELNSSFKLRPEREMETEEISQVKNVLDESVKELVLKKKMSIKRAATRLKMKRVVQHNLLRKRKLKALLSNSLT